MPVKTKTKKSAAKHHGGLTMIPLRSWVAFWFFILVTMTLVIVCFTNAFRSIDREASRETAAAFQTIRQNLEARVAELQGQVNKPQAQTDRGQCLRGEPAPIDNYLAYTDEEKSIELQIPFSTAWTNPDCTFAPAEVESGHFVHFGPYVAGELTDGEKPMVVRDSTLVAVNDQKSVAEIRGLLRDPQEGSIRNLRERTVGGMTVFSYTLDYVGPSINHWVALGRNYRYNITSYGWLTDAEAIKIIQSLRVTE